LLRSTYSQKKGKRKPISFSGFSETLDELSSFRVAKNKRPPKKASVVQEKERLAAVVSHPVFQVNPLKAVQNHLRHTLASASQEPEPTRTRAQQQQQQKKKKKKKLTDAEKRQQRYRKKMEKQASMCMDT